MMTASPIVAVRTISRHPPCDPEPGGEREQERQRLWLGHHRQRQGRRRQPVAAVQREDKGGQRRQQVDALVLAPPGADVDDGRMEQDDRGGHHGPERRRAERVDHQARDPQVGERRRHLHQRADPRIRAVGRGPERRFEERQHAPDVGHDRSERQVLLVGVAEAVEGDVIDPDHELVDVALQALAGEERDADRDAGQEDRDEGDDVAARPAFGRGALAQRLRRGPTPSTARPTRRRHRRRRSSGRRRGPHRPSRACCRTAARAGSRTGRCP